MSKKTVSTIICFSIFDFFQQLPYFLAYLLNEVIFAHDSRFKGHASVMDTCQKLNYKKRSAKIYFI